MDLIFLFVLLFKFILLLILFKYLKETFNERLYEIVGSRFLYSNLKSNGLNIIISILIFCVIF